MGQTNDTRTLGGGPIYRTKERDWIIVSVEHKDVLSAGQVDLNSSPTVTKLDSDYNLIWKKYLTDFNNIYDLIFDLEFDSIRNELILTGDIGIRFNPWSGALEGWICKMSVDGDILWSVADTALYDPNHYVQHHLGGVALSPSGSIYAAGYIEHSIPPGLNYGWIIKATPDGCIDTICTTVSIEEQIRHKTMPIPVYPNPTSNLLYIDLSEIKGDNFTMEFLSMDGRSQGMTILNRGLNEVILQNVIGDRSGLYIFKINAEGKAIGLGKVVLQR